MQEKDLGKGRLNFDEFCSYVEEEIKKRFGKGYEVAINEITKNNNQKFHTLNILRDECNFSPMFYLDIHYEAHLNGQDLLEIVEDIIAFYNRDNFKKNLDVEFVKNWKKVKGRILYKLINYEKNREMLLEVPHKRFLDLAIVYYIAFEDMPNGHASILIHNDLMKMWEKTADDLHKEASKNTPYYRMGNIMDMSLIMKELRLEAETEAETGFMYILTNSENFFGASTILYPNVLKQFAEKMETDFYIIPSSVHEVLLIPYTEGDADALSWIVNEVNQVVIKQQEYLSDSVYKFSRETGEISIIAGGGIYE